MRGYNMYDLIVFDKAVCLGKCHDGALFEIEKIHSFQQAVHFPFEVVLIERVTYLYSCLDVGSVKDDEIALSVF